METCVQAFSLHGEASRFEKCRGETDDKPQRIDNEVAITLYHPTPSHSKQESPLESASGVRCAQLTRMVRLDVAPLLGSSKLVPSPVAFVAQTWAAYRISCAALLRGLWLGAVAAEARQTRCMRAHVHGVWNGRPFCTAGSGPRRCILQFYSQHLHPRWYCDRANADRVHDELVRVLLLGPAAP